jgi:DNA replication initiation complex subunit (GINS family)
MQAEEDVNYNRLIHILQQEKKGGSPVPLQADFHDRVREYLESLRASYDQERSKDPSSMKALQLADQLQKARVLQVDIINLRLRKFLLLAHQTLTGAAVETKAFTPEEKALFEKIVAQVCAGRNRILEGGEAEEAPRAEAGPAPSPPVKCVPPEGSEEERREARPPAPAKAREEAAPADRAPSGISLESDELVVLRILEDVPDFAIGDRGGTSLRKKDVVALPRNLARALEQHKKAKPVI